MNTIPTLDLSQHADLAKVFNSTRYTIGSTQAERDAEREQAVAAQKVLAQFIREHQGEHMTVQAGEDTFRIYLGVSPSVRRDLEGQESMRFSDASTSHPFHVVVKNGTLTSAREYERGFRNHSKGAPESWGWVGFFMDVVERDGSGDWQAHSDTPLGHVGADGLMATILWAICNYEEAK